MIGSPLKSNEPLSLYWTRAIVVALLGIIVYLTLTYCFHVYYDRELAFRDALACSIQVLKENNILFWLQNGTLLGSTRLGRLVLWDADLDIGYNKGMESENFISTMQQLDSKCFGSYSSVRKGLYNAMQTYRKCTKRICAEFHETVIKDEIVFSGYGSSPQKELLPLSKCTVAEVEALCPHNASYYLKEAYGNDWLTRSLTDFF